MTDTRREHDSLGPVDVPADRLWGAQTQRSLENFPIGRGRFVWGRPFASRRRPVIINPGRSTTRRSVVPGLTPNLRTGTRSSSDT